MKSTATIMMFQSSRIFLFYKGSQNTYVYNKIVVRLGLGKGQGCPAMVEIWPRSVRDENRKTPLKIRKNT